MATRTTTRQGIRSAGGILDRIVEKRLERLARAKAINSPEELMKQSLQTQVDHQSFREAINRQDRTNIIAEIKRQSPSKGIIREDFDHLALAESYVQSGAAAMSVLTEEDFFGGSLNYLCEIHEQIDTPLLRKDFIIDEYQIFEAHLAGASAILLITAILDDELLSALMKRAEELTLDALVEVHTKEEMLRATEAGAQVIGVNNRDLTTFKVELETSLRLAELAPRQAILVSESGISTEGDICLLKSAGFKAFLIGEHFMRQSDVGQALKALMSVNENR
jgi:indole-3-glycerol phosphate synthase